MRTCHLTLRREEGDEEESIDLTSSSPRWRAPMVLSSPAAITPQKQSHSSHFLDSPLTPLLDSPLSFSPIRKLLGKKKSPLHGKENSPAVEKRKSFSPHKLEEFRKVLELYPDAWISWKDEKGIVRTLGRGLDDEEEGEVLMLPLKLEGNRDSQVKPVFVKLVKLMERSSYKVRVWDIVRSHGIQCPLKSELLKSNPAMKNAYADIREFLRASEIGQLLKGGVLKLTPRMLDIMV